MHWLDSGQRAIMAAIDHGPALLPESLFMGPPERVLAGMAVHANTISHARLVALEETFPRTRDAIGHGSFNAHSRSFLQRPATTARPLAAIGEGFDAFLIESGEEVGAVDLARFEWLWLAAYHAADVEPLELAALAGLVPQEMLALMLVRHPSAVAGNFAPFVHDLIGAEVPGIADAESILIARPDAEVLVFPASAGMAAILAAAENPQSIGNLLSQTSEPEDDEAKAVDASMQALAALINAGALIRA
jgi:hypothetical protein